ncbi:pyridoxamine 5'-phosphate oxidase family protein [Roseomonas gilardii]|uniref:pyridoxamine 5'-phosphate oxidase family protein n=1 Tax=Roseomonas gilardii TaxID=257708 RepID=UPI0004B2B907|nr:pyridoxamine 5'-phosphate oxidase family protein [Roseomonas gilardii]SUE44319.1 PPOX class probable FMN-dependent enzyme, alr4036 family [Roseomonas gilardii subsp. rosea]
MTTGAAAPDAGRILPEILGLLQTAPGDRDSGWRLLVLATGTAAGPRQRMVVLRDFDPGSLTLRLHCDARSGKVGEIAADPRVSLLGWDGARQWQIRLEGEARLHRDDALAEHAWTAMPDGERRSYATLNPPGGAVPAPPPPPVVTPRARANFCAITVRLRQMEWLHLDPERHRRARFRFLGHGVEARWLIP